MQIEGISQGWKQHQKHRASQHQTQPQKQIKATRPMKYIRIDVCLYAGYYMLVPVDYFSDIIWPSYIVDQTTAAIIEAVMIVFRCSGYLSFLFSDNAPYLASQEMQDFCRSRTLHISHCAPITHNQMEKQHLQLKL